MAYSGEADIAIATEAVASSEGLIALPCYRWHHCVLVPPDHPLLTLDRAPTLEELAAYPLVTYDFAFAGRTQLSQTFAEAGLEPQVVLTALDADVITWVGVRRGGYLRGFVYDFIELFAPHLDQATLRAALNAE